MRIVLVPYSPQLTTWWLLSSAGFPQRQQTTGHVTRTRPGSLGTSKSPWSCDVVFVGAKWRLLYKMAAHFSANQVYQFNFLLNLWAKVHLVKLICFSAAVRTGIRSSKATKLGGPEEVQRGTARVLTLLFHSVHPFFSLLLFTFALP